MEDHLHRLNNDIKAGINETTGSISIQSHAIFDMPMRKVNWTSKRMFVFFFTSFNYISAFLLFSVDDLRLLAASRLWLLNNDHEPIFAFDELKQYES